MVKKNLLFTKHLNRSGSKTGILVLIFLLLFVAALPKATHAQNNTPEIILGKVDKSDFPKIKLNFEVRNATVEQRAEPLKASDISILEGEEAVKISKLDSQYTGTHFMFAINTARNLALVDNNRVTNYDKLISAVKTLGSQLAPEAGNHFSLFINPDSEWRELGNYSEWLTAIDSYEDVYGMRRLDQSFASLDLALTAFEQTELDQETVLVYMMPHIYQRNSDQLMERVERAGQLGLPLHIWMVLEYATDPMPYEAELREKLEAGGGSMFLFNSQSEDLPDPRQYIEGMGYLYSVEYESALRASQTIDLAVQLKNAAFGTLKSKPQKMSVAVEAAQLRFLNLADELTIQLDKDKNPNPHELPIEVGIEFVDNYPREIVSTSLWINGKKAIENKEPPYGSFLIDLKPYEDSTTLKLEVKLDDSWGLQGNTGAKNLKLTVNKPETFIEEVSKGVNRWLILGTGLGILVLAAIFIIPTLRKKPAPEVTASSIETATSAPSKEQPKPAPKKKKLFAKIGLKKPTDEEKESGTGKDNEQSLAPSQTSPELSLPPARHYGSLLKLDQDSTPSAVKPFLLTKSLVYIGRDPKLADLVLDDPAIDPLHAELQLFDDGRATLTDFKTTAGTYRNFKAITANATPLQHGDILHFGTIMYRFHSATRTSSPSGPEEKTGDNISGD